LSNQNLKDRYHGTNDPLASAILGRTHNKGIQPPADTSISSLFVKDLPEGTTQDDLKYEIRNSNSSS